ncbi:hypothetical protein [Aneurinibacillus tyrosinisolvens]|uniref:hypothetical protein n=1 Tax=Aneurinibacillus tyrosinisolvens TaxID=1443435 RepID=UPI000AC93CEB|nr:hypothetical protein [Aneurinibacillus tyrosinisolvens]
MNKKDPQNNKPEFAPGDDEQLNQNASKEEIARGDYTEVTVAEFDEYDASKEDK